KGTIYQHNYPTLVDKDTFEKCQKVRTRMKNEHPKFIDKPFDLIKDFKDCAVMGQKAEVFSKIDPRDIVNMADEIKNSNIPI
ncbi:MAG: hypothetical protein LBL16_05485, partial [Endomicrobium sp.]|nr:hypothetical protein [Endomicrobium sp.]